MARHVAQAKGLDVPEEYERLVAPHVASFDWFLNEGLQSVVDSLDPIEVC
jgi:DNA-directed RNA polymerase beta subunit